MMSIGKEKRSEETKKNITLAAQKLFSNQGYDHVTMRQIAKEAGCSHTTIYLYFKDKEELLHHLAMPFLQDISQRIKEIALHESDPPGKKLKEISRAFFKFSLENRNIYTVLMQANATRVDIEETELKINKVRLDMFGQMRQTIQDYCRTNDAEQLLTFSRVFFYTLHGMITTYITSRESYSELIERLEPTFEAAIEILLLGFDSKSNLGGEKDEG